MNLTTRQETTPESLHSLNPGTVGKPNLDALPWLTVDETNGAVSWDIQPLR